MFYTCDNCERVFSDNEDGVIIEDDFQYCCGECEIEEIKDQLDRWPLQSEVAK